MAEPEGSNVSYEVKFDVMTPFLELNFAEWFVYLFLDQRFDKLFSVTLLPCYT